jgi:tetratricopeptide (TPR) repeat protein
LHRKLIGAAIPAALAATSAHAGDKVLIAPVPAWVTPAPPVLKADSAVRFDEQVQVDGDTATVYIDTLRQASSPEALLQMGTLTLGWQPDHGDLTVHKLEIIRGDQVIDALGKGEGITVIRREAGLERLMVDGQLTAVKHIEGLRVGDVLRMVFSVSERDTALGGHVQDALVLLPAPLKVGFGRARLVWRTASPLTVKSLAPGVTPVAKPLDGTWTEIVVPLPVAKLPDAAKNAPSRFTPLPLLQYSSFPDWASVAKVMAPLYALKDPIPAGSDLAARVDAIAAGSTDPVRRMADALRLVQDEVRYELIALGNGNYTPQAPADTWAKRYGDCKAKTMLLLAVLDRLGIKAEPVLASSKRGDAVPDMVPSALAFDHVFVHAKVGEEDFWLDGTMLGSRLADIRDVPRYGTVLPMGGTIPGSKPELLALPLRAHARPDIEADLAYDMTAGPHLATPYHLTLRYNGTYAASYKVDPGPSYDEKLTSVAEKAASSWIGDTFVGKARSTWDADAAVWTLDFDGIAYPDWKYRDGHYALAVPPGLKVTYDAPRDRASWRAIPALIADPWHARLHTSWRLPDGGKGVALTGGDPGSLDFPAANWQRRIALAGGELSEDITSRETGAEIAPDKASSTAKSIADAMERTARLSLDPAYPKWWDDVARRKSSPALAKVRAIFDARIADKPDDATRLTDRAWFERSLFNWAAAEADYTRAIALDASADRYLKRSNLRSRLGNRAGSLADTQAAYDLEQGNAEARGSLAYDLIEAGKVDEGLDLLPTSLDITTDEGLSNFLEKVDRLEQADRHDEALSMLDEALEKRGSSAKLRNARCWYLGLRNTALDTALTDCNKAIELGANPAMYMDSRALVHFRAGRLKEAMADYEAALADDPEQTASLYGGGIVADRMGDKAKAAAMLKAAKTVFPDVGHFYAHFGIKP